MTKRSALFAAATATLLSVGFAGPASAEAPEKVTVCHVNSANAGDSNNSNDWHVGREIVVAANAVDALVARGDGVTDTFATDFYMVPGHRWWQFLAAVDGGLVNADCAFRY